MKNIYLSVVIPAYNEERSLKSGSLEKVNDYLSQQKYSWEVIIANDGSTDSTIELAQKFIRSHSGFRLLDEPHRGKGGTVIAGMLAAKGDIVLFTDMDQSTPLDQIEKLLPKFGQGYDIAIGSRSGRKGAPLIRQLMAFGYVVLRTIVLRLPFKDTQCGFKAFSREASEKVFRKLEKVFDQHGVRGATTSAGFDVEVLYIARKMGFRIAEVPVEWHYEVGTRKNPILESWVGFKGVIAVRVKALLGKYR